MDDERDGARLGDGTLSRRVADAAALSAALASADGKLEVATRSGGPFLAVGDALDNDARTRDAFLALSPDPLIARWQRFRWLALGAPIAWAAFVWNDLAKVRELGGDVHDVVVSDAIVTKLADPYTASPTQLFVDRLWRVVAMREMYVAIEVMVALASFVVVIGGLRRWRGVVATTGVGAAIWALLVGCGPDRCVVHGGIGMPLLVVLGLVGAAVAVSLAPSETKTVARLRDRLDLGALAPSSDITREDRAATCAAAAACLALPIVLMLLLQWRVDERARALTFAFFCSACFLGMLAWRRETTRMKPRLLTIALAMIVGCGVVTACDRGSQDLLGCEIAIETCLHPDRTPSLSHVREASAKETSGARRDTQSSLFNLLLTILVAPISEELLYRGTLQRLARRALGARRALFVSALVFSVAHMFAFPNAFYQHFGLGLAFAITFELAGGGAVAVLASAGAHFAWNLYLSLMPSL